MKKSYVMGLLCFLVLLLDAPQSNAAINRLKKVSAPTNSIKQLANKEITVAVIDTGVDVNHSDLQPMIWSNPGESGLDEMGRDKATNHKDDDDNGYVDDFHGWNFVNNSAVMTDDNGHGTHIAGIVKLGIGPQSGAHKPVKLMVLKYYSESATDSQNIENTVKAINYAVKMGADVINYSAGGLTPDQSEYEALKAAEKQNIIVVAAAGNNKTNTDNLRYFPANYQLKNIISVAALDEKGNIARFSNYGEKTVDVAAPGFQIYSTLPNNKFGFMSGTSQATAFVSGFIAKQLAEMKPALSPDKILYTVLDHSQYRRSLAGKTKYRMALTER